MALTDYFALLGMERSFALDEAALRRRYLALQRESHPDMLIGKPERERAEAIQRSMDVSQGYEVLKNPLTRAEHLLALHGIVVGSEGRDSVKPEQALLAEIMELRERLMELDNEEAAARAVHAIKVTIQALLKDLGDSFAAGAYERAAQETMRLRYLGKALEEALGVQYRWKRTV